MCRTELFDKTIDIVSSETEVTPKDIISICRTEEVVEARHMLVYSLHKLGFSRKQISKRISISRQAVGHIITKFDSRLETSGIVFENSWKQICKRLEIK